MGAINVHEAGIILEKTNKNATLSNYIISGNIALVSNQIIYIFHYLKHPIDFSFGDARKTGLLINFIYSASFIPFKY